MSWAPIYIITVLHCTAGYIHKMHAIITAATRVQARSHRPLHRIYYPEPEVDIISQVSQIRQLSDHNMLTRVG